MVIIPIQPVVIPTAASRPSLRPSSSPTKQPVSTPVQSLPVPTVTPPVGSSPVVAPETEQPARKPVAVPTNAPVRAPIKFPTNIIVNPINNDPTAYPILNPSSMPSDTKSDEPTKYPSDMPSDQPVGIPSALPSFEPTPLTPEPTITPEPTFQPSTPLPSKNPSSPPSTAPTKTPTRSPTVQPTAKPTLTQQSVQHDLDMLIFTTFGELQRRSYIDFETATEKHISNSIRSRDDLKSADGSLTIADLNVKARFYKQIFYPGGSNRTRRSRSLQASSGSLYIETDVRIEFRSFNSTYNTKGWIDNSFDSEDKRNEFIRLLKGSSDSSSDFSHVKRVELKVDGSVPIEEPVRSGGESGNGSGSNLAIILGAVAGGAIVALLAGLFLARKSFEQTGSGKELNEVNAHYNNGDPFGTVASQTVPQQMTTEIVVNNRADDISTLGDPQMGVMNTATASRTDERTASVVDDYDYAKEYLLGQRERLMSAGDETSGKTSGTFSRVGSGPMGSSVFADDASFELQYDAPTGAKETKFDVNVPPGKLGMVIDTPNSGVPIVHAIKPESVLANKVLVGDKLVKVDGEDVTSMTAVQVSKMISVRSEQHRVLSFVRLAGRVPVMK